MKQIFLLLIVVTVASCYNQNDKDRKSEATISNLTVPKNYVDTIKRLEDLSTNLNYDSLGQLISKIEFNVKTDNLEDYADGKIPWIRIDSPQIDIKNLIGKDEIVIPETKITIIIDYPLKTEYIFELISKSGFTRRHLINEISKNYYLLYDEEEKTATLKTIPMKDRKIYNRNQTNGKYGIWGHDIGDLVLDEIDVFKNESGLLYLTLQIES